MREKRNHLTVLDTNMTIDTLPLGQKGLRILEELIAMQITM